VKSYVGVSGFSYASWKGRFYPSDTKSEEFLAVYSRCLGSVEINSSFYAPPSAAMVESWAAKTSEEFRFSFKAPRIITHTLKLGKGSYETASKLSDTIAKLGPRRGPILFQLPPFLEFDREVLDAFLSNTSSIEPKVFEFRHESWLRDSTYDILEDQGAGFCIADTEEMEPRFKVTGGLAYFRLRKDFYDANAIEAWSEKIRHLSSGLPECYVYLRHDETGENAVLAQRLSKKLQSL
jgi:uncharacterized protein YecE (DUF72 family)